MSSIKAPLSAVKGGHSHPSMTAIVGAIYNMLIGFSAVEEIDSSRINSRISIYEPLPYAILTFIMMLY